MSNNYLKVGKLYSLTSTTDTAISGASFIHGIYNNHGNTVVVTIDGLAISIVKDVTISFSVPVALSTVKIDTGSAIIIYS